MEELTNHNGSTIINKEKININQTTVETVCFNCKERCNLLCNRCKKTYFCSKECINKSWIKHKNFCFDKINYDKMEKLKNDIYNTIIKKIEGNILIKLSHCPDFDKQIKTSSLIIDIKESLTEFMKIDNGICHLLKNKNINSPYKTHFLFINDEMNNSYNDEHKEEYKIIIRFIDNEIIGFYKNNRSLNEIRIKYKKPTNDWFCSFSW